MVAENGASPAKLVPELESVVGLWRQRYGRQPIPERPLLQVSDLAPWSRHACWIELGQSDRFHIRKFGIALIRRFGREATGNTVDELAQDVAAGLHEKLWRTMAIAAPVVGSASVPLGHHAAIFSEAMLPLAGGGRRIRQFLLVSYELESKH